MNEFLKSYMPSLVVLPGDSKLAVALIESYKSIATFLVFLTDLANTLKQHTFFALVFASRLFRVGMGVLFFKKSWSKTFSKSDFRL